MNETLRHESELVLENRNACPHLYLHHPLLNLWLWSLYLYSCCNVESLLYLYNRSLHSTSIFSDTIAALKHDIKQFSQPLHTFLACALFKFHQDLVRLIALSLCILRITPLTFTTFIHPHAQNCDASRNSPSLLAQCLDLAFLFKSLWKYNCHLRLMSASTTSILSSSFLMHFTCPSGPHLLGIV